MAYLWTAAQQAWEGAAARCVALGRCVGGPGCQENYTRSQIDVLEGGEGVEWVTGWVVGGCGVGVLSAKNVVSGKVCAM